MSLLMVSLVLVLLWVSCHYLIPWLVQSNSTLALLWYDVLLEAVLNILTRTTRPQVTSDLLCTCLNTKNVFWLLLVVCSSDQQTCSL